MEKRNTIFFVEKSEVNRPTSGGSVVRIQLAQLTQDSAPWRGEGCRAGLDLRVFLQQKFFVHKPTEWELIFQIR
jgi:hypothetical protein